MITKEQSKKEITICMIEQGYFDLDEYYKLLDKIDNEETPLMRHIARQCIYDYMNNIFDTILENSPSDPSTQEKK